MASTLDDRQRFDRDREREPGLHRHPRCVVPARRVDTSIVEVACPSCNGPLFVPRDSDGEAITCAGPSCGRKLTTKQLAIGGVTVEIAEEGT